MSRRMSCSMTIDAVRNRTKTVTRRHVDTWQNLKPGDRLTLIEKGMGLPKGATQVILAEVEIVSVWVEPLYDPRRVRRVLARLPPDPPCRPERSDGRARAPHRVALPRRACGGDTTRRPDMTAVTSPGETPPADLAWLDRIGPWCKPQSPNGAWHLLLGRHPHEGEGPAMCGRELAWTAMTPIATENRCSRCIRSLATSRRRGLQHERFGARPVNEWGSGDLPAPYAEGDLLLIPADCPGITDGRISTGPGLYVIYCVFSVDDGDAWYMRATRPENDRGSDRLHVAWADRSCWAEDCDYLAGAVLLDTADADGLAKRNRMLANGWMPRRRPCPACGSTVDVAGHPGMFDGEDRQPGNSTGNFTDKET